MIRPRRTVPPAFAAHSPKPFRIIFFADPHPLTPLESHSYKKQGEGPLPSPKLVHPSLLPNRAQTRHTRHARVAATPIPSCACAQLPSPMGVALRAHFPLPKFYFNSAASRPAPGVGPLAQNASSCSNSLVRWNPLPENRCRIVQVFGFKHENPTEKENCPS